MKKILIFALVIILGVGFFMIQKSNSTSSGETLLLSGYDKDTVIFDCNTVEDGQSYGYFITNEGIIYEYSKGSIVKEDNLEKYSASLKARKTREKGVLKQSEIGQFNDILNDYKHEELSKKKEADKMTNLYFLHHKEGKIITVAGIGENKYKNTISNTDTILSILGKRISDFKDFSIK